MTRHITGCGRKRYVHAHHVVHWAAGGETSLANLMLLCPKHHALVHEGGFTITKDYRDRWFFKRPDGRAVPACGYRPKDITDDEVETAGEYFGHRASAEVRSRWTPECTSSHLHQINTLICSRSGVVVWSNETQTLRRAG